MGIHDWARTALEQSLEAAKREGFSDELALRALLSAVVERSAMLRPADDLAQELTFLADNLDPERDYSFMRP
ncbi:MULTISPECIES: hypothetical protein [unclassified Pseudomonas]|jgi:hypothetical protein|uniref:hypothetical protein n=1 Tax=unclassified Pseudomonas TaxID=196821 RepID=UPI000EAA7141|nr:MULTISPECIES: hypothetical protein [unclassified Pseudomonas]AYF88402.1 hypothetical protein D6Z43_15050 [Pseudomonas sp. DY-1]MDH4654357.1 hypothetical protein [Pseudomonas sp. BN606]MRK23606.1 hypothetical protein [Pseudomonas sp. JG-B]